MFVKISFVVVASLIATQAFAQAIARPRTEKPKIDTRATEGAVKGEIKWADHGIRTDITMKAVPLASTSVKYREVLKQVDNPAEVAVVNQLWDNVGGAAMMTDSGKLILMRATKWAADGKQVDMQAVKDQVAEHSDSPETAKEVGAYQEFILNTTDAQFAEINAQPICNMSCTREEAGVIRRMQKKGTLGNRKKVKEVTKCVVPAQLSI